VRTNITDEKGTLSGVTGPHKISQHQTVLMSHCQHRFVQTYSPSSAYDTLLKVGVRLDSNSNYLCLLART